MIEVDEELNYPQLTGALIQGHNVNTIGFPLYVEDGYAVVNPVYTDKVTDSAGRPFTVKNKPIFVQPLDPATGSQRQQYLDITIKSHPFGWKAEELARIKYQSILAQNYPFEVVVGEEWANATHIDTGASTDYFLSEGKLWLAPDGVVYTTFFSFRVESSRDPGEAHALGEEPQASYIFDTYYLMVEPDLPNGVQIEWRGVEYGTGDPGTQTAGWQAVRLNEEMPTTVGAAAGATPLRSIALRFTNRTSDVISIENYALFLRSRNYRIK
jgi:hypothetical protein